ncbi:MAG: hypothetical protein AAFN70_05175, partial [Planctomycetota bacterium]
FSCTDWFQKDLPSMLQVTSKEQHAAGQQKVLEKWVQEKSIDESTVVWANLPQQDCIGRFYQTPPATLKNARKVAKMELRNLLPIDLDELEIIQYLDEELPSASRARPVAAVAIRKTRLADRLGLFVGAGISVSHLQCDAIAIVNCLAHEFGQYLEGKTTRLFPGKKSDESEDESFFDETRVPGFHVIDAGVSSATLMGIGRGRFWFQSCEAGSERLISELARSASCTQKDAAQMLMNPALCESPDEAFQPVFQRMEAAAIRIDQIKKRMAGTVKIDTAGTWAVGGGWRSFGWIRYVLAGNK